MKKCVRILLIHLLTGASLGLTACEDKGAEPQPTSPTTQPVPQAQKATLTGQIQPVSTITLVTATDAAGGRVTAIPTNNGTYSFPDLTVGTYTLAFTPAVGSVAPINQTVLLTVGGTTVPTLTVVAADASIAYQVDGVLVTPPYHSVFPLAAGWRFDFATRLNGTSEAVTFFFERTPTVGTFSLLGDEGVTAQYTDLHYTLYLTKGAKSGTMTITSISTSPRLISGTFRFEGAGSNLPALVPGTRTITSGTFTNVPF